MAARILSLCTCLLLAACQPQSDEQNSLDAFAADFRVANQADTIEPMRALYELNGATERTVRLLENALRFELGLPIQDIAFEALSGAPEENIRFRHQGVDYGPTLEPRYRMRVRYATEDRFASLFTIGRTTNEEWRIVSSKPL